MPLLAKAINNQVNARIELSYTLKL